MPFKSLGAVSYSPSIVTMAVSAAILEIFSVKDGPDLENMVRVHSRSLPCLMHYNVLTSKKALEILFFSTFLYNIRYPVKILYICF